MKETVLVFNLTDKVKKLKLEQTLFPYHVRLKKVLLPDYNKTLKTILGLSDAPDCESESYEGGELDSSMLIFAGIPDNKLNLMLQSLRKANVNIPHKAILTPTNIDWTPLECFEELNREHEALHPDKV
jgi:hypothetical protein